MLILSFCPQDVYRARMLDQLELEESLYEAIIDIYRRFVLTSDVA